MSAPTSRMRQGPNQQQCEQGLWNHMRTLIIAALSITLTGCSCLMPQQAALDGCVSPGCLDRLANVDAPTDLKPAPFTPRPAALKVKSARAAKMPKQSSVMAKSDKPLSPQARNPAARAEENADAPTIIKPEPGATLKTKTTMVGKMDTSTLGLSSETSDAVLKKAKISIAAKMEDPATAEFEDMNRAMRKNTFGQTIDTICGRVKGKRVSGEDMGERPFLYLVKEDEAYVTDGNPNSVAATAYRTICLDARGKDSR